MTTTDLQVLIDALAEGNCILVLGDKIRMEGQLDLQAFIAQELIQELDKHGAAYDAAQAQNLAYIGIRWLKGILKRVNKHSFVPLYSLEDLQQKVKNLAAAKMQEASYSPVYDALAKMPFYLVFCASLNNYLYQAFWKNNKQPDLLHYHHSRHRNEWNIKEMSVAQPVIFNLLGHYEDESSLVITQEDQIEYIQNIISQKKSKLPNEVLQFLQSPDRVYLFVGFDANDWQLPLIFNLLGLQQDKQAAYYLMNSLPPSASAQSFLEDTFDFMFVEETEQKALLENLAQHFVSSPPEDPKKSMLAGKNAQYNYDMPDAGENGKIKILIMTSNPKDTAALGLNNEIKKIEEALRQSGGRDLFEIRVELDVSKEDLLPILLREKPQIIHFSGHGSGEEGLLFMSKEGYSETVTGEQLANLFRNFADEYGISGVLLNACYSQSQAQVIGKYIPNVVGTAQAIGDEKAVLFALSFYQALFESQPYRKAFEMAIAQTQMSHTTAEILFYQKGEIVSI